MLSVERLRITAFNNWTWKKRALGFISIFGGYWLFLEPLFAVFGGPGPLAALWVV